MREKRVLLSGCIILNYSNNTVSNDDNRLPMCSYVPYQMSLLDASVLCKRICTARYRVGRVLTKSINQDQSQRLINSLKTPFVSLCDCTLPLAVCCSGCAAKETWTLGARAKS